VHLPNPLCALASACAALLLAAAPAVDALPASILSCETNTARLCAKWTKTPDGGYGARWEQGSRAVIQVVEFTSTQVVFVRDDPSGTSAGMHAVYRGTPSGGRVTDGTVTWTYGGQTFSGFWQATW